MRHFDPLRDVENCAVVLGESGEWPYFHVAMIDWLVFDHGDMRPDNNVWIGPIIDAQIEVTSHQDFGVVLNFRCFRVSAT